MIKDNTANKSQLFIPFQKIETTSFLSLLSNRIKYNSKNLSNATKEPITLPWFKETILLLFQVLPNVQGLWSEWISTSLKN